MEGREIVMIWIQIQAKTSDVNADVHFLTENLGFLIS